MAETGCTVTSPEGCFWKEELEFGKKEKNKEKVPSQTEKP